MGSRGSRGYDDKASADQGFCHQGQKKASNWGLVGKNIPGRRRQGCWGLDMGITGVLRIGRRRQEKYRFRPTMAQIGASPPPQANSGELLAKAVIRALKGGEIAG